MEIEKSIIALLDSLGVMIYGGRRFDDPRVLLEFLSYADPGLDRKRFKAQVENLGDTLKIKEIQKTVLFSLWEKGFAVRRRKDISSIDLTEVQYVYSLIVVYAIKNETVKSLFINKILSLDKKHTDNLMIIVQAVLAGAGGSDCSKERDTITRLNARIVELEDTVKSLTAQAKEKEDTVKSLTGEVRKMEITIKDLSQKNERYSEDLSEAMSNAERVSKERERERKASQSMVESLRDRVRMLEEENEKHLEKISQLEVEALSHAQQEEYIKELEAIASAQNEKANHLNNRVSELEESRRKSLALLSQKEDLEVALKKERLTVQRLTTELQRKDKQIEFKDSEISDHKAAIKELREKIGSLSERLIEKEKDLEKALAMNRALKIMRIDEESQTPKAGLRLRIKNMRLEKENERLREKLGRYRKLLNLQAGEDSGLGVLEELERKENELQEALVSSETENHRLKEELEREKSKNENLKKTIESLSKGVREDREDLVDILERGASDLRQQLFECNKSLRSIISEVDQKTEENRQQESRISELETRVAELTTNLGVSERIIERAKKYCGKILETREETRERIIELDKEISKYRDTVSSLRARVSELEVESSYWERVKKENRFLVGMFFAMAGREQ